MITLTSSQKAAVDYQDGDSAIIAAAGSGKTRVLVEKVGLLIREGKLPLESILIVTFTEKAAQELKSRIARRLEISNSKIENANIGTLHAIATKMLRLNSEFLDISPTFQVLSEFLTQLEKVRAVRDGFLAAIEERHPEALDITQRYGFARGIRLLMDCLSRPARHRNLGAADGTYAEIIQRVESDYRKKKSSKNFLDFDDLERLFLALLVQNGQEGPGKNLGQRFRWLIVDEFQDINRSQWEILSLLHRDHQNRLVIVGDPRQSIYRFRGAEASVFDESCQEIVQKGGQLFYLNENFRSSPDIIEFVNQVTQPLFENYPPMIAQPSKADGEVTCLPLSVSSPAEEQRRHEAEEVSREIRSRQKEGYPLENITLLFRTRKAVPLYESALRNAGIAYETSIGEQLLEKPEILSLIFLMKKILSPEKVEALVDTGLQYSPLAGFNEPIACEPLSECLETLFEKAESFFEKRQQNNLKAFKKLLEDLMGLGVEDLKSLVQTVQVLRDENVRISCPDASDENVLEKVRLMTIHQAKGLEFPTVFLCDLATRTASPVRLYLEDENGCLILRETDHGATGLKDKMVKSDVFEKLEAREKEAEIEESKRLLYVALTRASERLILPLTAAPEKEKKTSSKGWADWIRSAIDKS